VIKNFYKKNNNKSLGRYLQREGRREEKRRLYKQSDSTENMEDYKASSQRPTKSLSASPTP
jgi:hypothetical protein